MKRNLIIVTLVVFAFSSVFLLSSCAKKQVVTEEKVTEEVTPAAKEEVKVEEAKPAVKEAEEKAKEEEIKRAERAEIERAKEAEEAKKAEAEAEAKAKAEAEAEAKARLERMIAKVEANSIYFDFDKSFIRQEYRPVLTVKAEFLKATPNFNLRIEGNCDERGTNEYNLALGERRATSAKKFLVSLGISPDRIETISYGEERPLALGHNEDSWSQNRRDDFVLVKK